MRLKLKDETQRTLWSIRCSDIFTMPTWVTEATSPLSKLTKVFRVAVIVVKHAIECTIWSVAPVSMTQSVAWKTSLLTTLAEKIEWFKEGVKCSNIDTWHGVNKGRMSIVWRCHRCERHTSCSRYTSSSINMLEIATLVLTLATWWLAPWSVPKLKRASNCSHCALEIGH